MNYKTYAEAKIANPDSDIYITDNGFTPVNGEYANPWVIANASDYCTTLEDYLDAGFELIRGDWVVTLNGIADKVRSVSAMNGRDFNDGKRYILSAAALSGGCKIPLKAEQWTIYNNTLPLCELTDEQVGKLVKHSGCVEHMNPNSGEWGATITPMWNRVGVYRIKPKSERELFIDKSVGLMTSETERTMEQMFGAQFDAGARYKDLTQHFGENI